MIELFTWICIGVLGLGGAGIFCFALAAVLRALKQEDEDQDPG